MDVISIILASGSGKRFGDKIPKQYNIIIDKPMINYSINKFLEISNKVIVVIRLEDIDIWKKIKEKYYKNINNIIHVIGGKERFFSVKNALDNIELKKQDAIACIHDSARPLVSLDTIEKSIKYAKKKHSAIPVFSLSDSIRIKEKNVYKYIDRKVVFSVQTPQTFLLSKIKKAYKSEYNEKLTDDATVYEKTFGNVCTFVGDKDNIKVTYNIDIKIIEKLIESI